MDTLLEFVRRIAEGRLQLWIAICLGLGHAQRE